MSRVQVPAEAPIVTGKVAACSHALAYRTMQIPYRMASDDIVWKLYCGGWGELLTANPFFFLKLKKYIENR